MKVDKKTLPHFSSCLQCAAGSNSAGCTSYLRISWTCKGVPDPSEDSILHRFIQFLHLSKVPKFIPAKHVQLNRPVKSDSANDRFSVAAADKSMAALYQTLPGEFADMRKVAEIAFSLNPSSAASERIFSFAGLVDTALRQNLAEVHLEKVMVLAYYLKDL